MKKQINKLISWVLIAGILHGSLVFANVQATGSGSEVNASYQAASETLTIGNDYLRRTFSTAGGRLKTTLIENLMGSSTFTPKATSEEFVIQTLSSASQRQEPTQLTSVKPVVQRPIEIGGSPSDNSEAAGRSELVRLLDDDESTFWATRPQTAGTAHIELFFPEEKEIKTLRYIPRKAGNHYNAVGRIEEYKVEYLDDEGEWQEVVAPTRFAQLGATERSEDIEFPQAVTTFAIKLTALQSRHWNSSQANTVLSIGKLDLLNEQGDSLLQLPSEDNAWKIKASSVATNDGEGINALIDSNLNNLYHSRYSEGTGTSNTLPIYITLDRGAEAATKPFQTFGYRPRNGGGTNGNIVKAKLYVSDTEADLYDEANLKTIARFDYTGVQSTTDTKFIYHAFPEAQNGRFFGIEVIESMEGNRYVSGSEIDLYTEAFSSNTFSDATTIKASELEIARHPEIEETTVTLNDQVKQGQIVTFEFEPIQVGASTFEIKQKVVMYNGDHFMRKFLEIKANDSDVRIEYIDGEHLEVDAQDRQWTIPTDKGGVVQMDVHKANLGQPIYINGLFLGSEFPATDTQIVDNVGRMRYFTGKNFKDFARDGQLTADGHYVTWQTVLGASANDGSNKQVVQSDFFRYITSIATPSDFRIQYNSWFDNMMFIDDDNILSSFSAVDKHLSATGVRPLDSYVVDDGWNVYRPHANSLTSRDDNRRNGVGDVNTTGFWEFNSKFPNELYPSSELVQNFGSKFGVWIGPRGGYNYERQLAGIIANAGKGSAAGGSIDVADSLYVNNFEAMVKDWMTRFQVNYWKWDGFADLGQYGSFPKGREVVGYSESNRHMYGGEHGFYHSTDLWEKWIVLMKNVRKHAKDLSLQDLWISLTCYVNPSPWYLQWANSVWFLL